MSSLLTKKLDISFHNQLVLNMNKKIKMMLIVAGAAIFFIYAVWRRQHDKIPNLGQDTVADVNLRLAEEKRHSAEVELKFKESEKENDSLKALIEQSKQKVAVIRKKRKDEAVIDYSNWNTDSITSAFAIRYRKK
jgi:cell shape-determining protein MreC